MSVKPIATFLVNAKRESMLPKDQLEKLIGEYFVPNRLAFDLLILSLVVNFMSYYTCSNVIITQRYTLKCHGTITML